MKRVLLVFLFLLTLAPFALAQNPATRIIKRASYPRGVRGDVFVNSGSGVPYACKSASCTTAGAGWVSMDASGAGDTVGPASSTDNAIVRFDGTTGKAIQNSSVVISDTGEFTFPDGVRQTFNPSATNAGLNVGSQAGDPSAPSNGDLWYDSTANELTARINGANVALGAGGGASSYTVYTASLIQSGTGAPVATVGQNTLGGTVTWARTSAGTYTATLTGAFTVDRTVVFGTASLLGVVFTAARTDANTVTFRTYDSGGATITDGACNPCSFEIRVYP